MSENRIEITTTLLNKVVESSIKRALTVGGQGDAAWSVSKVSRVEGGDGSWNAVVSAEAEAGVLARSALDDVRQRYMLRA